MDAGLTPDMRLSSHLVRPFSGFTLLRQSPEQEAHALAYCSPDGWLGPEVIIKMSKT